jgi:hypothetical protein
MKSPTFIGTSLRLTSDRPRVEMTPAMRSAPGISACKSRAAVLLGVKDARAIRVLADGARWIYADVHPFFHELDELASNV